MGDNLGASKPSLTPEEWHAWFSVQAGWTRPTRLWLYQQVRLSQAHAVLEVGCGTGVIVGEMAQLSEARATGLDLEWSALAFAHRQTGVAGGDRSVIRDGRVTYLQGDAHALPFATGTFDVVVCHYLLLWLQDPALGMREMARVVRSGGSVLVCAEPDYGGRVDYPDEMAALGWLQAEALRRQGADPELGRRLGEFLVAAGLQAAVGVMAGRWDVPASPDSDFEAEWAMRARDLAGLLTYEELERLQATDRHALAAGQRTLFVPTFYAWGRKI